MTQNVAGGYFEGHGFVFHSKRGKFASQRHRLIQINLALIHQHRNSCLRVRASVTLCLREKGGWEREEVPADVKAFVQDPIPKSVSSVTGRVCAASLVPNPFMYSTFPFRTIDTDTPAIGSSSHDIALLMKASNAACGQQ